MRKFTSFLSLGAAALIASSAAFAAQSNRQFFAYTLGSAEFADETKDYDYGFVAYPFNPSESDASILGTLLNSYMENGSAYRGVYAAAGVNGLIYACEYEIVSGAPAPGNFVVYNTFNGSKEIIGRWNPNWTDFKPQDMTWCEKDQKMYATGFGNSVGGLYEVDLKTGLFTRLTGVTNGGATLAAHPDGTLYSLNTSGTLYSIDKKTGKAAKIMDTKLGGMPNMQSMEFDEATGLLYWLSDTFDHPQGAENTWLQEIDINAKTIREIGNVGISARVTGIHIPSCQNLLAPEAPMNVKSTPAADGSLAATITWTNPKTAFNGEELQTMYGYVINRDGETVHTVTSGTFTPGEEMSWTDTSIPAHGEYRYDIYFYNVKGNGATGTTYQYIGPDAPGFVSNIRGSIGAGAGSITLTWDAPSTGRHFGIYDASATKYKVVRNDGEVVGDGLTECKVTDDSFVRVMQYSYTITAYNETGSSESNSAAFVAGPAIALPFEYTFEDNTKTTNQWTAEDGNSDGFTWYFNSGLGQSAFYDYEQAAEYIVSPGLGNIGTKTDEWLISPPLKLEAGVEYEVTVSTRSYTNDQFEIWMGDNNLSSGMTEKLGEFSVEHDPYNPDIDPAVGTVAFRRRSAAVPVQSADAAKCFGLHLVTDCTDEQMTHAYFQINGFYVGAKGEFSGVEDILADASEAQISLNGKLLTIFGTFRTAALYDLNGAKVLSSESAVIDLSTLASGVYVLSIDGRSFKLAL